MLVTVLNSASIFILRFLLTDFEISSCRSEERDSRAMGKEKTRVLLSQVDEMFISRITVTLKRYTKKE